MNLREIIEHNVIQGSPEWFALRIGRLTNSQYPDLMPSEKARTKFTKTQLDILRRTAAEILTGESQEKTFTSAAMEHGTALEPEAREYIADQMMMNVRTCGFFEYSEYIGGSPDGIIANGSGVLELKCPNSDTHLAYWLDPEELWNKYKWQLIGHIFVTGADFGFLASYDNRMPESKRMVAYELPLDHSGDLHKLEDRLNECVEMIKEWVS